MKPVEPADLQLMLKWHIVLSADFINCDMRSHVITTCDNMELVNGLVMHENTQPLMHLLTTLIGVELQGNAQLSYVTAKLTEHSWADRLQLRGQCTNEEYSSANVAAGMTSFIWTIRVQPSWLVAADLTLSWRVATEPSDGSWAELTYCKGACTL